MIRVFAFFSPFPEPTIASIVLRVLHIIKEEEATLSASLALAKGSGLKLEEREEEWGETHDFLSASAIAAANRSALRAPSLLKLLEGERKGGEGEWIGGGTSSEPEIKGKGDHSSFPSFFLCF